MDRPLVRRSYPKGEGVPPISSTHTATQLTFPHISPRSIRLMALFVMLSVWPSVTLAEVRVVTAQGEHRMGDRDTREDAIRLATEAAKRNALEQVANTTLDGDTIVVRTNLVAQIDTEEVKQAIAALRENEDARHQLVSLRQENDQLQQDLDAANQALAQASTAEQTQQAAQQRQDILNRVQSNAMVSQAWTNWVLVSPAVYPSSWLGLAQTQALLSVAQGLYPASPHVQMAQQVITTRQPSSPPQPPAPPAPGTRPPAMPSYQITPAPGSQMAPRTLNEITYHTPTVPPHIGHQPSVIHQMPSTGSRSLTDVRQLNPFLPSPSAAPPMSHQTPTPGSRSTHALQQFLQQPQAGPGTPPVTNNLPPAMHQPHSPAFQHVPHAPPQMAPQGFGGGGHHGGGSRGGGGGGHGHGGGGGRGR